MTKQQQQIIDSLVAEFTKINNPMPNGFARIGEALGKCDEWKTLKAGVEASNLRFISLRTEMVENDFNRLVEECRLAGLNLRIKKYDDYITIDNYTEHGYATDNKITIYYRFWEKRHNSNTSDSIREYTSIHCHSYAASSSDYYSSIEKLFQVDRFFNSWTKLIEISRTQNK